MSELNAVDTAWQAANDANKAFGVIVEKNEQLNALQVVASMSVEGIVIPIGVVEELEREKDEASDAFANFQNTAAPVMLDAESPFASKPEQPADGEPGKPWRAPKSVVLSGRGLKELTQQDYIRLVQDLDEKGITATPIGEVKPGQVAAETIFNFGAAAFTRREVVNFAKWRGYPSGSANAAFGPLWKESVVTTVEVPSLEEYEQTVTDEVPDGLVRIRTPESHAYEARPDDAFDIRTLHRAVVEWVRTGETGIKNLREKGISFWADYLNHALPGIEPLPVAFPPSSAKKLALEKLPPDQLLFATIQVEGQDTLVVNHKTMRQFATSIGIAVLRTTNFLLFFENLAQMIDPAITSPGYKFEPEDSDLVFARDNSDASSVRVWGINPQRFLALVEEAQENPFPGYTEFSGPIIRRYAAAIRQFLNEQASRQ